jgi:glycosyltransferase 2 family protein
MTPVKLISLLILLALMAAGIGLYTDISQLAQHLVSFGWWTVPPALALALANYLLRFGKWHYYLKAVGHRVRPSISLQVFLSGLSMSVTPGKVGEVLKSYLLKKSSGVPVSSSVPVVVAERLTDLLSLLVLALFGVITSGYGADIMVAGAVLCGLVVVLALWGRAGEFAIDLACRLPVLAGKRAGLLELQRSMLRLVGLRNLIAGTVISVAAWFAECLAFYLVLHGAGISFSLGNSVFVYSLGTIAGAVTMLPGGLIATEASMVYVLVEVFAAATRAAAVTAVLVVRICTLWFAVLVGVLALGWLRRRLR